MLQKAFASLNNACDFQLLKLSHKRFQSMVIVSYEHALINTEAQTARHVH